MNTENQTQDTVVSAAYNPFPEPQTIPSGWDTSTFYATPVAASTSQADSSVEGESA